jgi:excisionase family DNA binding protein
MNVLTVPTAAQEFNIPEQTLYSAIREGRLEAQKVGGTWIIEREGAERFAETWTPRNQAERPKGKPMTIYISRDAESWGAKPTDAEVTKLVEHTKQIASEWTSRPVEVKVVDGAEAFTRSIHNDPLAEEIAEAAWNRMFS